MFARFTRWHEGSLENRIAFSSTALVLLAVTLFGAISYRTSQEIVESQIAADLSIQSEAIAREIGESLESQRREVAAIAANTITANGLVDSSGRSAYLEPFLREHPLVAQRGSSLALCDFQGQPIASAGDTLCGRLGEYGKVIESASPRAQIAFAGDRAMLVLGYPVRYPGTGQIEGAIVASLRLDPVFHAARARMRGQFQVTLSDGTGKPVLGPAPGAKASLHVLGLSEPLAGTGLRLHIEPDLDERFAPLRRLALVYVALGIALTLGVNALSRLVSRRIAKPVRALVDAARRIGKDVRAQVRLPQGGRDEISQLAGAFADMQGRLRESYEELEERVRERTARLDAIFSLSPDGFVSFDASGRVAYVNPSFLRMTGVGSAQVVGLDQAEFDRILARLCDKARPYRTTVELAAGAGAERTDRLFRDVLHLAVPARRIVSRSIRVGPAGWPELILYFRDVTHESEVDRMKSEFLSTAAHELRTPMASILGFSELLLNRPFDEARRREVVQTIHRQSQLLTRLLNELLDLARIEARQGVDFHFVRQPLAPIIGSAIDNLFVAGDGRKVQTRIAPGLPEAPVDETKLQQALTNVLSNAYKYSPAGGPIELDASVQARGERPGVCITVTDHGIGMTPEQSARAFERFFRADSSGSVPGTGLGLALVKEIVALHEGEVDLESRAGKGTRILIWLPSHRAAPASVSGA